MLALKQQRCSKFPAGRSCCDACCDAGVAGQRVPEESRGPCCGKSYERTSHRQKRERGFERLITFYLIFIHIYIKAAEMVSVLL